MAFCRTPPPGSCELLKVPKISPPEDDFVPLASLRNRRRRRPQAEEPSSSVIKHPPPSNSTRHAIIDVQPGDLLAIVLPTTSSNGVDGKRPHVSEAGSGSGSGQHAMYLCSATASFAARRQEEESSSINELQVPATTRTLRFDSSTSVFLSADTVASVCQHLAASDWRRVCSSVQESKPPQDVASDKIGKGQTPTLYKYVDISIANQTNGTERNTTLVSVGIYVAPRSVARPLLTLTLRIQRNSDRDKDDADVQSSLPPLASALAKRLMTCRILFVDSTTTLYLPPTKSGAAKGAKDWQEVKLNVEAVMPDKGFVGSTGSGSGASKGPFIVFPSTRITILGAEKSPESRSAVGEKAAKSADKNYQSAATKTLIQIIKSVRTFASAASASGGGLSGATSGFLARSILFTGPPGVGKTYAAKMACTNPQTGDEKLDNVWRKTTKLVSLRGSDLLSHNDTVAGASKQLAKIFHAAAEYAGSEQENVAVIFLDECDALMNSVSCSAMLATLLDTMDLSPTAATTLGGSQSYSSCGWLKTIVVAATNRIDAIPAYLRRPGRFDKEIGVSPPDAQERAYILRSLLDSCRGGMNVDINKSQLSEIADVCVGYVAADLSSLVRKAATLSLEECANRDLQGEMQQRTLSPDHLFRAMADAGASTLRDAAVSKPPTTTWDDIAGDAGGAKTALRRAIEWPRTKREDFSRLGLTAPRGILLHGPPGCAKTTLARAAAGSAGVAFLSLSPADVYASSYVGEAEAIVRRAFALAQSSAPCILFFDEVDSILGSEGGDVSRHGMGRGGRGSSAEARVLSTLLNEMDGVDGSIQDGVLVLGATNRPDCIDAALLRPGRFDKVIYVPPPDVPARRAILKRQCEKWGMNIDDKRTATNGIDIDHLASDDITGSMTGAEIVGACREAAMLAIRESLEMDGDEGASGTTPQVTQEHLLTSLKSIKPLLSDVSLELEYSRFQDEAKW